MAKYVDIPSIMQVIGNIFNDTSLLDNEKYFFVEEDFTEEFHKALFGSIYNLHALGAEEVSIINIEDYLSQRPKLLALYKANRGHEYLQIISENCQIASFDYYYKRMKKMTLLRMYQSIGMDLSWLYDVDSLNLEKKQIQENWLDNTSIEDIANIIDKKIMDIRLKYVDDMDTNSVQIGSNVMQLIENLKDTPEVGYPLFGKYINTITRGARLKKLYLRSAATGAGKTRSMIADACSIASPKVYDKKTNTWVECGAPEPTLYIATEQDLEEIQTLILAFLSEVDEEHILNGDYYAGEWERVVEAANIMQTMPLYLAQLPDFSLQDIEDIIKKEVREHNVRYVFHDYIHSSMKILSEVSSKSGVKGLREDNILFMLSIRLKDLCNQYGIFIMTATQLNGDYKDAKVFDQNLLRGSKAIADKVDCGMIILEATNEDQIVLEGILSKGGFEKPGLKISIYKNRRGRYKNILIWCKDNRGTCRIEPMFITNYQYEIIDVPELKINVKPNEESVF